MKEEDHPKKEGEKIEVEEPKEEKVEEEVKKEEVVDHVNPAAALGVQGKVANALSGYGVGLFLHVLGAVAIVWSMKMIIEVVIAKKLVNFD